MLTNVVSVKKAWSNDEYDVFECHHSNGDITFEKFGKHFEMTEQEVAELLF